jgi:hypothetical protein
MKIQFLFDTLYSLIRILLDSIFHLSQLRSSFHLETMNFLLNKKTKPPFALKSIENSNLFQRRVSNSSCLIDNNELSRQMLMNFNSNHVVADKHDKITNTLTPKYADNSTFNDTKYLAINETARDSMETQLGKSLKIEINNGLVDLTKINEVNEDSN